MTLSRAMTEDELLQAITEAATYLGWRWHHVRRSDKALQQGHSGFPDLVLARNGRVIFIELKSETGTATHDQIAWLNEIDGNHFFDPGAPVVSYLARPSDLDVVLRALA